MPALQWNWMSIGTSPCAGPWCAADAGPVINPDGARNQLEGGIVHAASMTLKEQVTLERVAAVLAR